MKQVRWLAAGVVGAGLLISALPVAAQASARSKPLNVTENAQYQLVETITITETGMHAGKTAYRIGGQIRERVTWRPGGAVEVEAMHLRRMRVREGRRLVLVPALSILARLKHGHLAPEQVTRPHAGDVSFREAAPTLERALAYALCGRPTRLVSAWRQQEAYDYGGIPVTLAVHFQGHPEVTLSAKGAVPARPEEMDGHTLLVAGSVTERGQLSLAVSGGPPRAYRAVTTLRLVARYLDIPVEWETAVISLHLTAVPDVRRVTARR